MAAPAKEGEAPPAPGYFRGRVSVATNPLGWRKCTPEPPERVDILHPSREAAVVGPPKDRGYTTWRSLAWIWATARAVSARRAASGESAGYWRVSAARSVARRARERRAWLFSDVV